MINSRLRQCAWADPQFGGIDRIRYCCTSLRIISVDESDVQTGQFLLFSRRHVDGRGGFLLQRLNLDATSNFFERPQRLVIAMLITQGCKVSGIHLTGLGKQLSLHVGVGRMLNQDVDQGQCLPIRGFRFCFQAHLGGDVSFGGEVARYKIKLVCDVGIRLDCFIDRKQPRFQISFCFVHLCEYAGSVSYTPEVSNTLGIRIAVWRSLIAASDRPMLR